MRKTQTAQRQKPAYEHSQHVAALYDHLEDAMVARQAAKKTDGACPPYMAEMAESDLRAIHGDDWETEIAQAAAAHRTPSGLWRWIP